MSRFKSADRYKVQGSPIKTAKEVTIRLLEIHIEVEDLKRSLEFYKRLLPHKKIIGSSEEDQVFMVLSNGSAFGLWKKGTRGLHDGRGAEHLHFAFQISAGEYDEYKTRLESLGVEALEHD